MRHLLAALAVCFAVSVQTPAAPAAPSDRNDRNVVVVTVDGFRWQELFGGADRGYFRKTSDGKPSPAELRFWRDDVSARRTALLPFFWGTIAAEGAIFGDQSKGSRVHVTNGLWFSYPGYSEMLTGVADP